MKEINAASLKMKIATVIVLENTCLMITDSVAIEMRTQIVVKK